MSLVLFFFKRKIFGVLNKMLDCDIIESDLDLQSFYYVSFWTESFGKRMDLFINPAMLKSITNYILQGWHKY